MNLEQHQPAQQYLDLARECMSRLPEGPHREFSQLVIDIDQAMVYMNTGEPEAALTLLNQRFPPDVEEMSDLFISVKCLRAGAEKEMGHQCRAMDIMEPLISLPVSTTLSLGTLMEAWQIALDFAIELMEEDKASAALAVISKAYADSTSLDNRLTLAKARVNYHRKFGNHTELMAAYGDFYDLSAQIETQEHKQTAEALGVQMRLSHMQSEMEKAQRDGLRMQSLSVKDELTGLANRRGWRDHLHQVIADAKISRDTVGLVLLDLDHFKRYNDQYGHLIGDKVLCMAARSLSMDTEHFFPGRYGGDEFILIYRGMDAKSVEAMLDRVYAYLEKAQQAEDFAELPHITFSAGYVIAHAVDVEQESALIEQADQTLYLSKKANRNCYQGTMFTAGKKTEA